MTQTRKEKISLFLEINLKFIFLLTGIFLLSGGGLLIFVQYKNKKEKEAVSTLYNHKRDLILAGKKINGKDYGEKNQFLPQILSQKKDTVYSDEMKQSASKFEQALKSHPQMKISVYFAIDLADFYFKSGEKERARSLLEPFAKQKNSFTVYQLSRLQLAAFYMDEKLCKKALSLLEGTVNEKKQGVFDMEIYIKKGICYEETNQREKAKEAYRKAIAKDPESFSASKAKDYLLTMRLKQAFKGVKKSSDRPN